LIQAERGKSDSNGSKKAFENGSKEAFENKSKEAFENKSKEAFERHTPARRRWDRLAKPSRRNTEMWQRKKDPKKAAQKRQELASALEDEPQQQLMMTDRVQTSREREIKLRI
jgi:hypothetical protein